MAKTTTFAVDTPLRVKSVARGDCGDIRVAVFGGSISVVRRDIGEIGCVSVSCNLVSTAQE
jgi:hypothetical protein